MQNQPLQLGCRCLMAIALTILISAETIAGSSPELNSVSPRGVQRGGEHTLYLHGVRLNDAQEVFFYGEGITTKSVKVIDHKKLEVIIDVAGDCRLGENVLQVRCGRGISDFRSVFVGPFPAVAEKESNNDFASAQKIELGQTATGQIEREDVDFFVVTLGAGDRMSVEVEAMRLGTFSDTLIAVYDSQQNEIAACDDTELFNQDGFLTVTAPADGDYFVMIRDAAYNAGKYAFYRLHIGDFDRPRVMFPPGGKAGTTLKAKMFERPVADVGAVVERGSVEIKLPEVDDLSEVFHDGPSPLPLRVSRFENFIRADDAKNLDFKTAIEVQTPVAINGRLTKPGQLHFYKFKAQKNQKLSVDVFAKRIGSPMDPIVNVFDEKYKAIISSDDAKVRPDSYLVFNPPADGTYFIRVHEYFQRSAVDMVYRVEVEPIKPMLTLNIKRNGRFSQTRMAMAIPQGGRFAAIVSAKKENFSTDVELQFDGLPEGVTVTAKPLKKTAKELPVVFEATEDAAIDLRRVSVSAKAVDVEGESPPLFKSEFKATSLDSRGPPNNFVYHPTVVDELAVGVVEPLPFRITVQPLEAPLVRNGSAKVKVTADRDEGFNEKIRLQFPYRSPGVGTTYQIEMKADQTEIEYSINANKSAQLGNWPFYVLATANVEGPAWTSSQLQTLSVEEPFVAMESQRSVGARNETVTVVCEIEQLREFDGEATAALKSLPPHVTVGGTQTFDKTSEKIAFEIKTTDKTPFGQHKNIFVEVSVPVGKGRSVARAGNVVLQVNRPVPQPPSGAITKVAK